MSRVIAAVALVLALAFPTIALSDDAPTTGNKKYKVQFENAKWDDVLKWYAETSGLAGAYTEKPAGKVTLLTPKDRTYTLGEATDLINEALMQQKYILIRRERTFTVWPADEKIDRTLIPHLKLSQLAGRGQTELVQVDMWLREKKDAKTWAAELT